MASFLFLLRFILILSGRNDGAEGQTDEIIEAEGIGGLPHYLPHRHPILYDTTSPSPPLASLLCSNSRVITYSQHCLHDIINQITL